VRDEHDEELTLQGIDVFPPFDSYDAPQAFRGAPPADPSLHHTASERAEMLTQQPFALLGRQIGKAQTQIDACDSSARSYQAVGKHTDRLTDRRQHAQR
jgi:hypothetical protein